jgi:hypothetical protein
MKRRAEGLRQVNRPPNGMMWWGDYVRKYKPSRREKIIAIAFSAAMPLIEAAILIPIIAGICWLFGWGY